MSLIRMVLIAPLMLAAGLGACGGSAADSPPTAPPPPARPVLSAIAIDAASSSVPSNGTLQLSARPVDENGNAISAPLAWSSSNTGVATVSAAGLVVAGMPGVAVVTVTASSGAATAARSLAVNVMPPWGGTPPPLNLLVNDASKGSVPNIAQREPTIAVFGSRIVVGWNDETVALGETVRGFRHSVSYGFSTDGGSTFRDAGEVGSSHWGADATLAVDRAGNFYYGRMDLMPGSPAYDRIAVFKSTDGGATFPQVVTASGALPAQPEANDKPTITVDNTGSPFDGNVYVSWTLAKAGVLNVRFSRSTDAGSSYTTPVQLSTGGSDQSSIPAVGPDGELYVVWHDQTTGEIFIRKSMDGGVSFAPAVRIATARAIGELESETAQYCGRVLKGSLRAGRGPSIAVDRSSGASRGAVYVAFSAHGAGADAADVHLTSSRDGGATWSVPSRLNDDATSNDQWLPFVITTPNGSVAVSWYDRRLDPDNLFFDLFMRISGAGGTSFGPNMKITERSSPPAEINRRLGFPPYTCYQGSYNFMAADGSNVYLVWTDNRRVRSSTIDANIFFAKVPH
mgnify:CR=1 FL=1